MRKYNSAKRNPRQFLVEAYNRLMVQSGIAVMSNLHTFLTKIVKLHDFARSIFT